MTSEVWEEGKLPSWWRMGFTGLSDRRLPVVSGSVSEDVRRVERSDVGLTDFLLRSLTVCRPSFRTGTGFDGTLGPGHPWERPGRGARSGWREGQTVTTG